MKEARHLACCGEGKLLERLGRWHLVASRESECRRRCDGEQDCWEGTKRWREGVVELAEMEEEEIDWVEIQLMEEG